MVRVVRLRRGARILDGKIVISEIPGRPSATDTPMDLLAAAAVSFGAGPRLALLGFAGGGVVAPLRALGVRGTVDAVDLSTRWESLFRELTGEWSGPVRLSKAEASEWLRRRRSGFDVVLEDLSEHRSSGVTKPWVSVGVLPPLIRERLRPGGVAAVNLLPWPEVSWKALIHAVRKPFPSALLVSFAEWENRVLILGNRLPPGREASRSLRSSLRRIGSSLADGMSVRSLPSR